MAIFYSNLTYTDVGKKKNKKKWANSDAKQKAERLKQEWDNKVKEWNQLSNKPKQIAVKSKNIMPAIPVNRRTTQNIKSLDTGVKGAVSTKPSIQYTGEKVLGITIVHKSCLQPVFSQEQAVDAAHMRR